MPRYANFVPEGVIPACLLPFHDDLSIDEASFRRHLSDVAAVPGLSAESRFSIRHSKKRFPCPVTTPIPR